MERGIGLLDFLENLSLSTNDSGAHVSEAGGVSGKDGGSKQPLMNITVVSVVQEFKYFII